MLKELIQTERDYVKSLGEVVEVRGRDLNTKEIYYFSNRNSLVDVVVVKRLHRRSNLLAKAF